MSYKKDGKVKPSKKSKNKSSGWADIEKGAKKGARLPVSKGGKTIKILVAIFVYFMVCGVIYNITWWF